MIQVTYKECGDPHVRTWDITPPPLRRYCSEFLQMSLACIGKRLWASTERVANHVLSYLRPMIIISTIQYALVNPYSRQLHRQPFSQPHLGRIVPDCWTIPRLTRGQRSVIGRYHIFSAITCSWDALRLVAIIFNAHPGIPPSKTSVVNDNGHLQNEHTLQLSDSQIIFLTTPSWRLLVSTPLLRTHNEPCTMRERVDVRSLWCFLHVSLKGLVTNITSKPDFGGTWMCCMSKKPFHGPSINWSIRQHNKYILTFLE